MIRVVLYVQHLLGIGHLRRAVTLADGLAAAGCTVTVIAGGPVPDGAGPRRATLVQLPPVKVASGDFSTLHDVDGVPVDAAWKARRAAALAQTVDAAAPEVLIVELFPFGRRQMRFELEPLLDALMGRADRPRIVCSVRDILVAKSDPKRIDWIVDRVRHRFDAVWVHGDPGLVDFAATFPAADRIADRVRHTGYVVDPDLAPGLEGEEVLVSAGGGAVGTAVFEAALAARARCGPAAALPWRVLIGPNTPNRGVLLAAQLPGIIVEPARPDFPALLARARVSVGQAGYNTTVEALAAGARMVLVPYDAPGETEQPLRAAVLAARGLATVVRAADLAPGVLAAAVDAALARPRPTGHGIDLGGVAATVKLVKEMAG